MVMKGKQYNKRVRALKIIYEAPQRMKLETFKRWLYEQNKKDILVDYLEFSDLLQLINDIKKTSFNVAVESCECIFQLFLHFDQSIYSKLDPVGLF